MATRAALSSARSPWAINCCAFRCGCCSNFHAGCAGGKSLCVFSTDEVGAYGVAGAGARGLNGVGGWEACVMLTQTYGTMWARRELEHCVDLEASLLVVRRPLLQGARTSAEPCVWLGAGPRSGVELHHVTLAGGWTVVALRSIHTALWRGSERLNGPGKVDGFWLSAADSLIVAGRSLALCPAVQVGVLRSGWSTTGTIVS